MGPKRGLSLEEKRMKIMEIFLETKDVYQLKDVEKLAAKEGVVLQTVKDVLQSLVDDDMVHQDRIGASNYFWAFPSELSVKLESSIRESAAMVHKAVAEQAGLRGELAVSMQGREDSELRGQKMRELTALKMAAAEAEKELALYADNDPVRFQRMKESVDVAKTAANRWLDNLWILKGWCRKSFEGREAEMEIFFKEQGYSGDMDYV